MSSASLDASGLLWDAWQQGQGYGVSVSAAGGVSGAAVARGEGGTPCQRRTTRWNTSALGI